MAQVGLHGMIGLLAGIKLLTPYFSDRVSRRGLMFGYVVGNLAPDLDFLAVVGMYPVDHTLAFHMHRGFTHSLLAAAATALGFSLAARLMQDRYFRFLGYGFALGIVTHFLVDLLIWFAPVDVFWPLSVWGVVAPVNLWGWWKTPLTLGRLLGAAELAAFGLYFDCLGRSAITFRTDLEMLAPLRRWSAVCWTSWAFLSALAFDLLNPSYDFYVYFPVGIVFIPACFYLTWRMQVTIELLGLYGNRTG